MNKEIKRLKNLARSLQNTAVAKPHDGTGAEAAANRTNFGNKRAEKPVGTIKSRVAKQDKSSVFKNENKVTNGRKHVAFKGGERFRVEQPQEGERINKLLARIGYCSRRKADELLAQGSVLINGVQAGLGSKFSFNDTISVAGKVLKLQAPPAIYIALNKPKGIVCTTDLREPDNIVSYMGFKERIFPIGRLDKESTGLILLTNDGSVVNRILRERYGHSKEYAVEVDKPIDHNFVKRMEEGVHILDQLTKPCKVKVLGPYKFKITLTQGLNRQIRRMCEALGYQVKSLQRLRIMHITLGNLQVGEYRHLSAKELSELKRLLAVKESATTDDESATDTGVGSDNDRDASKYVSKSEQKTRTAKVMTETEIQQ